MIRRSVFLMTIFLFLGSAGAAVAGTTAAESLIYGAMDQQGLLAAEPVGYSVPPTIRRQMTPRDAAGTPSTLAYVATRPGTAVLLGIRHRLAGGVATQITYTLWVNEQPTAIAIAVAANSAVPLSAAGAQAIAVGDRVEVVATVGVDIVAGDCPDDIVAYVSY